MIKLCTIDLDGTLFDAKKNISIENINAIKKAKENGCKIVIATGRPISGVLDVLSKLQLDTKNDYVICYNGGKIINVGTNETIYQEKILAKDIKRLYQITKEKKFFIHAFRSNGELITPVQNQYTDVECSINHIPATTLDFDTLEDDEEFIKVMVVDDEARLDTFAKEIDPYFYTNYTMVRSSKIFLEFLNKKVDKGLALLNLAEYLGVPMDETMAIGDAGNDYSMIEKAHIGVAMANAFKEILDIADYITTSNEESGVAMAINHFINNAG